MKQDLDAHIAEASARIDTEFNDRSLLLQALTHRSYLNEHPEHPVGHNERLEFLGDAVLQIVVTEHLYRTFPDEAEGKLTNLRSALVNAETLSRITEELGIDRCVLLSRGEAKTFRAGDKARRYILANAYEALLGAIYLDQGLGACRLFVDMTLHVRLSRIVAETIDAKSGLLELAQERWRLMPTYRLLDGTGPEHDRTFVFGVFLDSFMLAQGTGSSKKEAQFAAAKTALETITQWEGRVVERVGVRSPVRRSGKGHGQ